MGTPIPRMVMHPTLPGLDGLVLDDARFNCALGVGQNLFQAFVDVCRERGDGYVDYLWPKPTPDGLTSDQPKVSHVRLFEPWQWVIGSGVYIDDIEAEARQRQDAILDELDRALATIRIADHGYMFIFDGISQMLVHPTLGSSDVAELINPGTNRPLFDELIEAAVTPDVPFEYYWSRPDDSTQSTTHLKRAYVRHYEPLDWFICASTYVEETEAPVYALRKDIAYLTLVLLLAALLLSLFLSRSLAAPLTKLTSAAVDIERTGIEGADIPVSGTRETRELGAILGRMIQSIRLGVDEKEKLLTELNQTNVELLEANAELQEKDDIIASASSAIVTTDIDGIVTYVNEAFLNMWGSLPSDQIVGRSVTTLWATADKGSSILESLRQTGRWFGELQARHHAGHSFETQVTASTVRNRSGELIALSFTAIDITDLKRVERQLAQTRSLLIASIEQTPVGILIADGPDVNIRIANPAALATENPCMALNGALRSWETE